MFTTYCGCARDNFPTKRQLALSMLSLAVRPERQEVPRMLLASSGVLPGGTAKLQHMGQSSTTHYSV